MTTTVLEPETQTGDGEEDGLTHTVVCVDCLPDLAICGKDVSGEPWFGPEDEAPNCCVVCEELAPRIVCPKCGF